MVSSSSFRDGDGCKESASKTKDKCAESIIFVVTVKRNFDP